MPAIQTALIAATGSWAGDAIAAATPVAPGSSCPRAQRPPPRACLGHFVRLSGLGWQRGHEREPGRAPGERMTHPRAVGQVDKLIRRGDNGRHDGLLPVANRQRRGGAEPVGELAQDRIGFDSQTRLHTAGQFDQSGAEGVAPIGQPPHEMVVGEGRQQAVDRGAVRLQRVGELDHGHPVCVPVQHR